MTDSNYINDIWNKYESKEYLNNSFFKINVFENNLINKIRNIISIFIYMIMITGLCYAGINFFNSIKENNSFVLPKNQIINENYIDITRSEDFNISNDGRLYYSIIDNLEKFNRVNDLISNELKEIDFNYNCILLISPREENDYGTIIESYEFVDDKLIVNVFVGFEKTNMSYVVIPKEKISKVIFIIDNYIPKPNIYNKITIKDSTILNNDYDVFYNFLKNIDNNIDDSITIETYEIGDIKIIHTIEYKNNVFYYSNNNEFINRIVYEKYDEIVWDGNICGLKNKNSNTIDRFLFKLKTL